MIATDCLSKSYGLGENATPVLRNVSISIKSGEFCALTGPSGSGKTTLMNLLGLLDSPTEGDIEIDGKPVAGFTSDQAARFRNQTIGFVFQSFHLLRRYTALDNVALPLIYRGIGKAERHALAEAALSDVGLVHRLMHRPDELSGGQRQRVAIARALIGRPPILLADEPTGNLDSQAAQDIMALFYELNERTNLTVVIVTHDPGVAARCPRQIVLRDGRVAEDKTGMGASFG